MATFLVKPGHVLEIIMKVNPEGSQNLGRKLSTLRRGPSLSPCLPDLKKGVESYEADRWQGRAFLTERPGVLRYRGTSKACWETCLPPSSSVMSWVD